MASHGTKVTRDPEAENRIEEGTGIVTSDSLAAESMRSGGDFAANVHNAAISDQTSRGFTGNTTDTSSARRIHGDGDDDGNDAEEARMRSELDATREGGKDAGVGPTYNVRSSANDPYAATAGDGTQYGGQGGLAPTSMQHNVDTRDLQPKGENLKEGGDITGDEPNASFGADIGSKNDPSLAAEKKFARENADAAIASGFQRDSKLMSEGGYDQLRESQA
ncbi:uncharacterized protein PV09_05327 [Verruconis gallopava]|uniref:SMP domain-containing protein n=1 Tax=Verruconis gallopava TaxID=253628 RepID=A0A0D1YSI7_9PEZI|nr:uncharacterized protein PV09_05327 [Verruconis gallopava]KIW03572.1 hypothetical protein PV09_05327 [Verruconis gallopava]